MITVCADASVAQGTLSQQHNLNQLSDLDAYIRGTSNVKKDTVKCHEKSNNHLHSLKASLVKTEVPAIQRSFITLDEEVHKKICKLMDSAYTVAYCEQPFTVFQILLSVAKKHGVNLGQTYMNDKACQHFISEIGGVVADDLQALFQRLLLFTDI